MRSIKHLATIILLATFTAGFNSPARAAEDEDEFEREFSDADLALIKNYPLTTEFVQKWTQMNQDPKVLGCHLDALTLTADTIDLRAEEFDARPGIHDSLAAHGLNAREVVLGTTSIAVTSLEFLRGKFSWLADTDNSAPMPTTAANVQFYRDHQQEFKQLMKIGEKRKREDRRKPECRD
jgi:hypothetical protein